MGCNLSLSGNTYAVKKQNGKWGVTNDQMNILSRNTPNRVSACVSCAAQKIPGSTAGTRRA